MNALKMIGMAIAAAASFGIAAAPAMARPDNHRPGRHQVQKKQVCKYERHHGKRQRVCHWVRR